MFLQIKTKKSETVEEAEVKVGMPRRVSSRVPVAGAVRGVTGAAADWGSVASGGGAAVMLRRGGVEGMDEYRVRPDRSWRAMECGILTQLVSYGWPTLDLIARALRILWLHVQSVDGRALVVRPGWSAPTAGYAYV